MSIDAQIKGFLKYSLTHSLPLLPPLARLLHTSLFFHFSGHGGSVRDLNGDEADGMDETILPIDHDRAGQIIDDEIHDVMVRPLQKGVRLTAIFDSCHRYVSLPPSLPSLPPSFPPSRSRIVFLRSFLRCRYPPLDFFS